MEFARKAGQFLITLLLPTLAYGALTATDRGTGSSTTSEAATVMSPSSTIAAGSTGALLVGADNAAGSSTQNMPVTITDSVGNVWSRVVDTASALTANAGAELAYYISTNLTTQLTSSNNVTVTYTAANVTAKTWVFTEITPAAGKIAIIGNRTSSASNGAASPTVNSSYVQVGAITLGACAAEGSDTFTPDSDTSDGSWSTHQHTAAGSGASGMSITSQYKIQTTGRSIQTYNLSLTAADLVIGIVDFKEADLKLAGYSRNNAAATTFNAGLGRILHAGSMGVLAIATDNAGNLGSTKVCPSTITDAVGNVWTLQLNAINDPGAASAGAELGVYTAPVTTDVRPAVDTITVTWDAGVSVTAKCSYIWEFVPDAGKAFAFVDQNSTTASSASPTITTSSLTNGDIVIGAGAAEGDVTWAGDADTTNGSWSLQASSGTSSGAAEMSGTTQYKTVTADGTQTYNPTLTSADLALGWVSIRQSSVQSATNGFFSLTLP